MLASLLLGALIAGVPAVDQNQCPARHHNGLPAPATWFVPQPPTFMRDMLPRTFTATAASDAIAVDLTKSSWYPAFVGGGGNGAYALYDTAHGVSYVCSYEDTAVVLDAAEIPLGWVARDVQARPLSAAFRTSRGIAFGAPIAAIEAVYGKAKPFQSGSLQVLAYEKKRLVPNTNTTFITRTTFFFANGKLVAVERLSGV